MGAGTRADVGKCMLKKYFSKEVLKKWKCVQDSRKILMQMHYPKQKIPVLRAKVQFFKNVVVP